jgi:shikimate kinase
MLKDQHVPKPSISKRTQFHNVVITGFMGTGKTTVGRLLAQKLGFVFVDTDDLIVAEAGKDIPQIFTQETEAGFRRRERGVIRQLRGARGLVIATGGGAILSAENLTDLRALGPIICLWASEQAIYRRLRGNRNRPLLAGDRPLQKIKALLRARTPNYRQADKIFDTTSQSPRKVTSQILRYLGGK